MTDTPLTKFGLTLRTLREEMGYSQEGFAHMAKLDRAFYGRMERGKQNVSLKTVWLLSARLGVPPAALFSDVTLDDCRAASFEDGLDPSR